LHEVLLPLNLTPVKLVLEISPLTVLLKIKMYWYSVTKENSLLLKNKED